ncbi:MAG: type I 3-dehydroquinate dehydratase [Ruminococcaceae bacterium]|nr:type I 3-dehydroquinate dehydratase [Oscillospiraceae bacterium]
MKPTFLKHDKPLLTTMVQATTPARTIELMDKAYAIGAEAFGMQFCQFPPEYRNEETYRMLFEKAHGLPVYVTNYRGKQNVGKSDDVLAKELTLLARCGATLCDVIGDLFDPQPDEFTSDPVAVKKQMALIDAIHEAGGEVLMSSHTHVHTPEDRVLEIALGQQARGADVCKIVIKADTQEEELEAMRLITLLKKELKIPFLFLCGGASCHLLRRVGETLGNCTTLCVYEYDDLATPAQPLLADMCALRKVIG